MPDLNARLLARQPDKLRPQVMAHRWESLLFLHWRISPDLIQSTLPPGLFVDTFDGDAWLAIIPFFMRNVRLVGLPAWPRFSAFQELNVRTYVYDESGTPGVWFYSLECNQPLAVNGARLLTGLNYCHAQMSAKTNEFITYNCQRRGLGTPATYVYRGEDEAGEGRPDSFEFFFLERYYFFALRGRSLVRAQVSHAPYRYRRSKVTSYSTLPVEWNGLPALAIPPDHQCFVDSLEVKIFATKKVL
jgi:uncharacterized protein YqjF (DUF2071 family)